MEIVTILTPLYHRPMHILPTQIPMQENLRGEHPMQKIMRGDVPTHSPYKIFRFFLSPEKNLYHLLEITMPPHASQHIPIHPHAPLFA